MVRRHSACDARSCVVATQIPPRRRSYRTSHPVSNMSGQSMGIPSLCSPLVGARTPGSLLLEAPTGRFVCGSCRLCTTHSACSEAPHHTAAALYPVHSSPSPGSGYSASAATMWCGCGTSRASALRNGYSRICNRAVLQWTCAVARYAQPCRLLPVSCAADADAAFASWLLPQLAIGTKQGAVQHAAVLGDTSNAARPLATITRMYFADKYVHVVDGPAAVLLLYSRLCRCA